jgi:hypothetical protein
VSETEIQCAITFQNGYADHTILYFRSKFSKAISSIDSWEYEPYTRSDLNYGVQLGRKCNWNEDTSSFSGKGQSGVVLYILKQKTKKRLSLQQVFPL